MYAYKIYRRGFYHFIHFRIYNIKIFQMKLFILALVIPDLFANGESQVLMML